MAMTREELAADGMMTLTAAAKFADLSKSTLYDLMNKGRLPYSKMGPGSRRLIPRRALVRLMAEQMVVGDEWEGEGE